MEIQVLAVGMLEENCYLAATADRLYIIDPGDEPELIVAAAGKMPRRETVILLTHAHVDHIRAVSAVAKALGVKTIYLNNADKELYASPENNILPYLAAAENLPPTVGEYSAPELQILPTPGHTPGGVGFYFPDAAVVFSGDTLFSGSVGRTDLPGGNFDVLSKSITSQLFTLPDAVKVCPGHGPATSIGTEKRSNPYVN